MIDRVVGGYRLIEKLGDGGMGAVFKGIDEMIGREVAVKMLRPEIARQPEVLERFRSEAVTLAKLSHQGIATLYNFFREGDEYFMAMEFVPGRTLESELLRMGRLSPERAVAIAASALDAIGHAHQLGVLHRDIKPANIMLTPSGGVKMTDFGIARVLGAARTTREGRIVGTLEYIAPERIKGDETDCRSDLYSMGIVLYEMLAGRLPFDASTDYDIMRAHLEQAPPPLVAGQGACPPELEQVVRRSLAKNPQERFGNAGEFHDALATAASSLPKSTRGESAVVAYTVRIESPPEKSGASRRWKYAAIAAVIGALGLGLAAWRFLSRPTPIPSTPSAAVSTVPAPPVAAPVAIPELSEKPSVEEILKKGREMISTPAIAQPAAPAATSQPKPGADAASRRRAALQALGEAGNGASKAAQKPGSRRADALKALEK